MFIFFHAVFVIETKGKSIDEIQRELRGEKYKLSTDQGTGGDVLMKSL